MTRILLGTAGTLAPRGASAGDGGRKPPRLENVHIDLDVLLFTRLLIQANSGGGKSYLLRRIAEQAFGKVQLLIIDPEGEFSTLREKYDFVLVGKGGETPADPRSAGLVAHKLLELNASAVCDLYEMKASQRHAWVRAFLEALIDAPRDLWHSVLVIVDEAHTFCPEKGAGESEASDAMIGLATRGRKRGFCAIFATQRLGKLRKDAAAELTNVLIGQTFIDVDRKRAAEALGIPPSDLRGFSDDMKVIEPGHFWALGRAITKTRLLVTVGGAETTHPRAGTKQRAYTAPPPPEKIKALLPKLSDLPKEAEAKAKTEAELRTEIVSLRRQLQSRPTVAVPEKVVERVEVPVVDAEARKAMAEMNALLQQLGTVMPNVAQAIDRAMRWVPPTVQARSGNLTVTPQRPPAQMRTSAALRVPPDGLAVERRSTIQGDGAELSGPEQRILDAIAWFESIGIDTPNQVGVAFLAGYVYGAGGFNNPRGALNRKGLVEYVGKGIRLTDVGRAAAKQPAAPLTIDEMHAHVRSVLPGPETAILNVLLQGYPQAMPKEQVAEASGYQFGAGGFNNPIGRLRTLGLVQYPQKGYAVASKILFLEST